MTLKILVPFQVFADKAGVMSLVVETPQGSYGLLPHRLDCVTALAPGILVYQLEGAAEAFVAVDHGVLIKTGPDVFVSVRRAIAGTDLATLRSAVEREFLSVDEHEQGLRAVMAKRETGLLHRFSGLGLG